MDKTNTIENLRHTIDELSIIMYNIYVEWKVSQRGPLTESEHMAENMYRMMIFKAKSIGLMSQGVVIVPTQKGIIPDPSTMYPVLRSMYELLFLFKSIFASSKNDVERELLLKVWQIRGNNNLIQIPNEELDEESLKKKKSIKEGNKTLRTEIRELMDKLHLSASIRDDIERCINNTSPSLKGFMFEHCEHCDTISKFRDLNFSDSTMGLDLSFASYIYSHYSAHSHPSYLGLKHFEEMYPNKEEDNYVKEILGHACKYTERFIKEFCKYNVSYSPYYEQKSYAINEILSRVQTAMNLSPTLMLTEESPL